MNELLNKVLTDNAFVNSKNETVTFHSHTSKGQCEFLQNMIEKHHFTSSVEIGFAYGTSTFAITDAITKNGGSKHVVIDVYENKYWGGNGLELLRIGGLADKIDFREDFCYKELPRLLLLNETFDFAYVDSTKQFDWIFCNFFYIDKLLRKGGIIVFDDVSWPGVRKVMRFISRLKNYKNYDQFPACKKNIRKEIISNLVNCLPLKSKIFSNDLLDTDYKLKLSSQCVAFQKVDDDTRNWDWFVNF